MVPDVIENLQRFAEGRPVVDAVDRTRGYAEKAENPGLDALGFCRVRIAEEAVASSATLQARDRASSLRPHALGGCRLVAAPGVAVGVTSASALAMAVVTLPTVWGEES